MGKILSTLLTVIIAVGVSGALWIGANLIFNQVRGNWRRFTTIVYGMIGFVIGVVMSGNRVTVGSEGGFLQWVWLPLLFTVGFAVVGISLDTAADPRRRLIIGTAAGLVIGVALGLLVAEDLRPELSVGALVGWTVGGAAVVGGLNALRKHSPVTGALVGAAIGALIGGWGEATIGSGSVAEAVIAMALPAMLIGIRLGLGRSPDYQARVRIDTRSRAVIFLSPALLFILIALVIPAIRTGWLSLLDRDSEEFVKLDNYIDTFQADESWDPSNWTNMFTSRMFYVGIVLLAIAVVVGVIAKKRTGRAIETGNPTVAPLLAGALLVSFAAFTSFRGTIVNNLWWVVTVVFFSTALGLAVAVLADGAKTEKFAKSLIFMPLAVSLVGASVIWRFMYVPRDNSIEQTGLLNALWVGLGRLSTGSGIPTFLVGILAGAVLAGLLYLMVRALTKGQIGRAATPAVGAILVGWFFVRYTGIIGEGIGGFTVQADGSIAPNAVGFIQEPPFNNFWLMVILIWIQTGFAMVILSAAIKAVPDEILEAARVDGGTKSQIFWRVTLPQIATTIGVVVTTLIVLVMKVFDIVKVVTNGNFGTQVLANDMYNQSFSVGDTGRGAALAIILFVSVLPVMIYNIRRMQKENDMAHALPTGGTPTGVGDRIYRRIGNIRGWMLWLVVIVWSLPTFGILVSSFRTRDDQRATGWWKVTFDDLTIDNYKTVLNTSSTSSLWNSLANSFAIAIPATIIPIAMAAFAAYTFAWIDFKGRKWLFIATVSLLAIPLQVALIPLLQLFVGGAHLTLPIIDKTITLFPDLDLAGTTTAVWLTHAGFALPFAIFLLHNYISGLPKDLFEAARIDGADHFTIFWRLVLPLSIPVLAAFAIFQFLWTWNDYLIANTLVGSNPDNAPTTIRIANLAGDFGRNEYLLPAAAFVQAFVPIVVFFALQRYFVRGLLAGSVKG